jgi:hypothetical protein
MAAMAACSSRTILLPCHKMATGKHGAEALPLAAIRCAVPQARSDPK